MWQSAIIETQKLTVEMGDSVLVRAVFKFKGTNNDEVKRKEMGEWVIVKPLQLPDRKTAMNLCFYVV